jgi:toxin-antitoxin system, toxin component, hipA family
LNEEGILSVPPLADIRVLMQSAQAIEDSELNNCLPEEKWLLQLLKPGSSLGGARPKATVRDENGDLWIAKFPSRSDDHDLEAWEQFAYLMARKAGITTAETKLLDINEQSHILLIKRFDRKGSKRTHFASSMTLLGLKDGDGAATGYGYLDIAGTIVENCV